ncbi:MAG: AAA family ATPase [Planctomycetota bacterium]
MNRNKTTSDLETPKQSIPVDDTLSSEALVSSLCSTTAYPRSFPPPVVMHETHISWVFLAGDVAYKIKKPIQTGFLDYSTLAKRHRFCQEEIRLDSRYTEDLYIAVVPVTLTQGRVCMEGSGKPIEYAVKMRRFPEDALLSRRLDLGLLSSAALHRLSEEIAQFHQLADCWKNDGDMNRVQFATPSIIERDFVDCLNDLGQGVVASDSIECQTLSEWATQFLAGHRDMFDDRRHDGYIRECHGDLHLGNVVQLGERLVPFDGIEFNEHFRWIDVLNDVAFLVMDFVSRGHTDFAFQFLNRYLERTGDYKALPLLRWYLVYRSLVRAKVAAICASQHPSDDAEPRYDCLDHLSLAVQFTRPETPCLWIMHGLSGSGKTTASEMYIREKGAIRVRSDLERKRMFQLEPTHRPTGRLRARMYEDAATDQTYERLRDSARSILDGGFSCIVDATFLKQKHRESFHELAGETSAHWAIVDCRLDEETLRRRIIDRASAGYDASDADIDVLNRQIATQEPLTVDEKMNLIRPAT